MTNPDYLQLLIDSAPGVAVSEMAAARFSLGVFTVSFLVAAVAFVQWRDDNNDSSLAVAIVDWFISLAFGIIGLVYYFDALEAMNTPVLWALKHLTRNLP